MSISTGRNLAGILSLKTSNEISRTRRVDFSTMWKCRTQTIKDENNHVSRWSHHFSSSGITALAERGCPFGSEVEMLPPRS